MSTDKMNTSEVFEMFETINSKLDKRQTDKSAEPTQIDTTVINTMTERFETVIAEARKPVKVEHRHTIDIGSSKVFIALIVMVVTIFGLSYAIGEQRRSISQYKDNDLKYRHIKMLGQTTEEGIYRLEDRFEFRDSVSLIRKQVETYEKLFQEQAERIERAKQNVEESEKLQKKVDALKKKK